jgi:hypothetical protein
MVEIVYGAPEPPAEAPPRFPQSFMVTVCPRQTVASTPTHTLTGGSACENVNEVNNTEINVNALFFILLILFLSFIINCFYPYI